MSPTLHTPREPTSKENAAGYTAQIDEVHLGGSQREGCGHAMAEVVVADDVEVLENSCDLGMKRVPPSDFIENVSERRGR